MQLNDQYIDRKWVVGGIFAVFILIFIIRLFFIQVADNKYSMSADSNSQRHMIQYPARGLVYDRNGILLVHNQAAYDLMVIPRQVLPFDTLLLAELLDIDVKLIRDRIYKAKIYSRYKPSIFLKQISVSRYARFQEHMFKFPGFYIQSRTLRDYPRPMAAHLLGYVGEVNDDMVKKNPYYSSGDYIGISGIEKSYEEVLRGTKGNKIFLVDVHNRIKGEFMNGALDKQAVQGLDLTTTLDAELQEYGEKLMAFKSGSIVAIEPQTGEILALVSSPTYDPKMLVGRKRSKNYSILQKDELKPLFNRALTAQYPPGSIFKIVNGLIGLQEEVINLETHFECDKSLVGCHNHPPNNGIIKAIQYSCNPYFNQVYRRVVQQGTDKNRFVDSRYGVKRWVELCQSFGLGQTLPIDVPNLSSGSIPGLKYYDKKYGKNQWAFSTIASNAIGQGEVMIVPLQMANLAAIFANSGYYIVPHIVKKIGENPTSKNEYTQRRYTGIDQKWFAPVKEAMYAVVNEAGGTARLARNDSIVICGKTGTVQNPHGEDHSVFIAFAPRENPQIALVVYVENTGFGGTWAAPIASLIIEKYLHRVVSAKSVEEKEKRIIEYTPLKK